jgi:hypothetical protein
MTEHETHPPEPQHPRDDRFAAQRMAARDPWYAVALAKAELLQPEVEQRRVPAAAVPLTSSAALAMRYPAVVAGGGLLLGVILWRSPWSRNALRLAALWGIKNVVSRKLMTMF